MSEQTTQAVELTLQDLTAVKTIIDIATSRGAFKANEMVAVGTVYNKLESFLNAVAAQQSAAAEETQPAAE